MHLGPQAPAAGQAGIRGQAARAASHRRARARIGSRAEAAARRCRRRAGEQPMHAFFYALSKE